MAKGRCQPTTWQRPYYFMEQWKDIPGYEGLYSISTMGNVKSACRTRRLTLNNGFHINKCEREYPSKSLRLDPTNSGYIRVHLHKDGHSVKRLLHRLVAKTFKPEWDSKLQINHKNGIKTDCRLSNLEPATPKENMQHASRILGVMKGKRTKVEDTSSGKVFDSIQEAHKHFSFTFTVSHLCNMIAGHRINKTTLKYH